MESTFRSARSSTVASASLATFDILAQSVRQGVWKGEEKRGASCDAEIRSFVRCSNSNSDEHCHKDKHPAPRTVREDSPSWAWAYEFGPLDELPWYELNAELDTQYLLRQKAPNAVLCGHLGPHESPTCFLYKALLATRLLGLHSSLRISRKAGEQRAASTINVYQAGRELDTSLSGSMALSRNFESPQSDKIPQVASTIVRRRQRDDGGN